MRPAAVPAIRPLRSRGAGGLLSALMFVLLWADPALAVRLGPQLLALERELAAAPAMPVSTLRLIASGSEAELQRFVDRLQADGVSASLRLGVARVDLPGTGLERLAGPERVTVDLGVQFRPAMDQARAALGWTSDVDLARSGRDVLLAVLDTGVDFEHPDFRNPDGSTRLVFYWDQTAPGEDEGLYGVTCDALDINEGRCPNRSEEPYAGFLPGGHGTHVAGIAAGGGGSPYRGIAFGSQLIGIRLNFDEAGVIDALDVLWQLAERWQRPVVVNLSLGANQGPHDGSMPSEQVIDAFSGPGRIVVAAAGNEGPGSQPERIHLPLILDGREYRGRVRPLPFARSEGLRHEVWWDEAPGLRLAVAIEGGAATTIRAQSAWMDPETLPDEGLDQVVEAGSTRLVNLRWQPWEVEDGARGVALVLDSDESLTESLSDLRWQLVWQGNAGRADAWLTDRNAQWDEVTGPVVLDMPGGITASSNWMAGDADMTLTLPGTAREVVTVTGFFSRVRWTDVEGRLQTGGSTEPELGDILDLASRGPTRDGRPKPEIAAPGGYVAATRALALRIPSSLLLDDDHWVQQGTSMAAPQVAGVAALLLEGQPGLDADAMVEALAASARVDAAVAAGDETVWGAGKLDLAALAAHPAWISEPVVYEAPTIRDAVARIVPGGWEVSWLTGGLSDSALVANGRVVAASASFGERHRLRGSGDPPAGLRIRARDPRGNERLGAPLRFEAGGCGCRAGGTPSAAAALPWLLLLAIWARMRHSEKCEKRGSRGREYRTSPA